MILVSLGSIVAGTRLLMRPAFNGVLLSDFLNRVLSCLMDLGGCYECV